MPPLNARSSHKDIVPRLDLENTSSSPSYPLHTFSVYEGPKRIIAWYDDDERLTLKHIAPKGRIPHPRTVSSNSTQQEHYEVWYTDEGGQPRDHEFELDGASGGQQSFTPRYYFSTEQQSIRFQCAVRQRQLLHTFPTLSVRRDKSHISAVQPLQLWQKPGDGALTISFYANHGPLSQQQHYECNLAWFKKDVKRNGEVLELTFYTEERRKSSEGMAKLLSILPFKQEDNDHSKEQKIRRSSTHSKSSSGSSPLKTLPGDARVPAPSEFFPKWSSLQIRFTSEEDVDLFLRYCNDPQSAPGPEKAPEKQWKFDPRSEEILHHLQPRNERPYRQRRRTSHAIHRPHSNVEDEKSRGTEEWLRRMEGLREDFDLIDLHVPAVGIAVIDTGIDLTNPAVQETWGAHSSTSSRYRNFLEDSRLANNLGTEPFTRDRVAVIVDEIRNRGEDTPQDDTGHGTHVAGIITRLCPEANLFIGRVLENNVTNEQEETRLAARRLALAIIYATDAWRVRIISLSIGFRRALLGDEEKAIVRNAIHYATEAQVIIFAAASNEGNRDTILFPASERDVFCMNSSDGWGNISQRNSPPREHQENFSILGENVRSTTLQRQSHGAESAGAYAVRSGTSVATPIAASVAAIIIHFGRQWEPIKHKDLETRLGFSCILTNMAPKSSNNERFFDIVPWHWKGVFGLSGPDYNDPVAVAKAKFEKLLKDEV